MVISCGPAGIRVPVTVPNWKFCSVNFVSPPRFRLEVHLEQGAGAGRTLSIEPCRVEPCDFTRCIVNTSALKESCAATCFQENRLRSR